MGDSPAEAAMVQMKLATLARTQARNLAPSTGFISVPPLFSGPGGPQRSRLPVGCRPRRRSIASRRDYPMHILSFIQCSLYRIVKISSFLNKAVSRQGFTLKTRSGEVPVIGRDTAPQQMPAHGGARRIGILFDNGIENQAMLLVDGRHLLDRLQAGRGARIKHALENRRLERLQHADIIIVVRGPGHAEVKGEILVQP